MGTKTIRQTCLETGEIRDFDAEIWFRNVADSFSDNDSNVECWQNDPRLTNSLSDRTGLNNRWVPIRKLLMHEGFVIVISENKQYHMFNHLEAQQIYGCSKKVYIERFD